MRSVRSALSPAGLTNDMSEKRFTGLVLSLAKVYGWRRAHFRPARVRRGDVEKYETPVAGDGKGFPDLVLLHRKAKLVIVAELKVKDRQPEPHQKEWLQDFAICGVPTYVWRPSDWEEIRGILSLAVPP